MLVGIPTDPTPALLLGPAQRPHSLWCMTCLPQHFTHSDPAAVLHGRGGASGVPLAHSA